MRYEEESERERGETKMADERMREWGLGFINKVFWDSVLARIEANGFGNKNSRGVFWSQNYC